MIYHYLQVISTLTKYKAFSFIQMMIVISIVAIFAAIGLALYRMHVFHEKIFRAMVIFDNIGTSAQEYHHENGVYPNLSQINLYHDPLDPTQSPIAQNLNEYIANYVPYTYLVDLSDVFTCPSAGYGGYISNLSNDDYVTQSRNGSLIIINRLLVYAKGSYEDYCQYYYYSYDPQGDNLSPISGNFIPQCINGYDDPHAKNFFANAANRC